MSTSFSSTQLLFSRYDAARALSVSFVTLDKMVKAEKIRCTRIGRRVLFAERDLQAFADKQRKESR